ncbi:origin of replication complex subunit 5 [Olea europaea subsp. europaea]|uniref:Origin of replication complex subunit 5 n=1 Tax=Olea europaea subsp. europaea TaxID=158383 RepID=A0A8S0TMG4_OLEEU|nr:origin of replication complex subunit 5 [Olea europaea subsp. europaea]
MLTALKIQSRINDHSDVNKRRREIGIEESPQVNRRITRLSSCTTPNSETAGEVSKIISNTQSLSVNDLVLNDESINLEELINSFPHRRVQILELIKLLGS